MKILGRNVRASVRAIDTAVIRRWQVGGLAVLEIKPTNEPARFRLAKKFGSGEVIISPHRTRSGAVAALERYATHDGVLS